MKIKIDDINLAFTRREIKDPKQFVGRYEEVKKSVKFLNELGAFLIVYGQRGLGKSSLANQIKLVAEGNTVLLKLCKLDKFIPSKGFNYIVHLTRCDHSVKDIATLVKRIVLGDEKNKSLYEHVKKTDERVDKALKLFAEKTDMLDAKNNGDYLSQTSLHGDIIQLFRQSLSVIQKDNQDTDGIIILIDEFDIIADKRYFSSLVKSLSDVDFVKFGIVGIADDISDLMSEHASIARQIEAVEIGLMNEDELEKIILNAESIIKNEIVFSSNAKSRMIKKAKGYPYHVHLIGKAALEYAFERDITEINEEIIIECEDNIKNGSLNSVHKENYDMICSTSIRELTLRLLAKHEDNYMKVEDLYNGLKGFNIEKPSGFINELTEMENPPIKRVRNKKFLRFSDPLFKQYINMRDSVYEDNTKRGV